MDAGTPFLEHYPLFSLETKFATSFEHKENKDYDPDEFEALFNAALDIYYNSCASSGPKQNYTTFLTQAGFRGTQHSLI